VATLRRRWLRSQARQPFDKNCTHIHTIWRTTAKEVKAQTLHAPSTPFHAFGINTLKKLTRRPILPDRHNDRIECLFPALEYKRTSPHVLLPAFYQHTTKSCPRAEHRVSIFDKDKARGPPRDGREPEVKNANHTVRPIPPFSLFRSSPLALPDPLGAFMSSSGFPFAATPNSSTCRLTLCTFSITF